MSQVAKEYSSMVHRVPTTIEKVIEGDEVDGECAPNVSLPSNIGSPVLFGQTTNE